MRKTIIYVLVAVIFGMGLAYFMNKQENFAIAFANLSEATTSGDVEIVSKPSLTEKSFSSLSIKLLLSNDSISYTFDIKNTGAKDGIVSSYVVDTPACSGGSDAQKICDNLAYKLVYSESKEEIKQGDIIKAGETKNVTLTIAYDDSYLPSSNITINNLGFVLEYKMN